MEQVKIAFIGGGNMSSTLIRGLLESGYPAEKIVVVEPSANKRETLNQQFSIQCYARMQDIKDVKIVLLAVKPTDVKTVGLDLNKSLDNQNCLLISIVAGITIPSLHTLFGAHIPIVRAMPNTGALLRSGATGLYAENKVSEEQRNRAESIMRSVGVTVWVNHEHDMDTVTALSGSGPAYFFLLIEALQQAAENLGLPGSTAKILTLQTALGAAKMALENELPIHDLIKRVASKGGTTEKALEVLESHHFHDIIKRTLQAAKERAEEISRVFGNDIK